MNENEVLVEDLSIDNLREYLNRKFSDIKKLTQKDIIRQNVEENNKDIDKKNINDKNLYYIDNIRQSITFYRGMDNEKHDIVPSIKRLYGSPKYYNILSECNYIKSLVKSPFINEKEDDKITINLLARMQHYNYKSRLVDITFNYAVAVYMSAYTKYLENGKVIEFTHKSNKHSSRFANVLNRYHYIASPSQSLSANLKFMNSLVGLDKKPLIKKNYESNPVVIIDRQTFKHNTAAYDLRYDAQEGAFIMFLNEPSLKYNQQLIDLNCNDLTSSKLSYRRVLSVNKIAFLFLLADNGVTYVTIYPDKDLSHEINKINAKLSFFTNNRNKLNSFDQSFKEYLEFSRFDMILSTSDIKNVIDLAHHYIDLSSILECLLTDYLSILEYRGKNKKIMSPADISLFNNGIDNLIKVSNNQLFKYLFI